MIDRGIQTCSEPTTLRRAKLLLVCLSLLLLASTGGLAQDLPEFGVVPMSAPNGILLVVGGPPLHPSTAAANGGWAGYNIYRKAENDTGFIRITPKPLSRPGSMAGLEKAMGGPLDGFERYAGLSTKQELWQAIVNNDSSIIAIAFLSKNFRRALGLMMTDTNVKKGVTYEYRATLVAPNGTESKPSEAKKAVFGEPMIPLLGPQDVKAKSTNKGVRLTWETNPGDSGVFSYSVYRCPDSVGTYLKLNIAGLTPTIDSTGVTNQGSFTDTTARAGRTYYYAVVSTDYAGNESPRTNLLPVLASNESRPAVPQNVFANPSSLGITITWDTVSGSNIVGYNIYRSTNADSNYTRLNTQLLPLDTGFYEDHGTSLSSRYFYRVTAVNRAGRESEKSARALSLFRNRRQPLPPQNVRAESRPNGIAISWEKSTQPNVRGYYVYRADGYNGSLSQVSALVAKDSTEFVDTSAYISSSGEYWYLVQALNYTGMTSNYSVPVAASPDKHPSVDAPTSFFGYQDGPKVRLFWAAADNNQLTGYVLYRAQEADSLAWQKITNAVLPRSAGEFTDTTADIGHAYLYQLKAVNDEGTEGPPSHNMRVMLFTPAPLPPAGVRVSQDGKSLKIVWNKTLQPGVVGYRIYRRSDKESQVSLSKELLPVNSTEYRDNSVKKGTRYYYSVSSVDKSGREGNLSPEVPYFCE